MTGIELITQERLKQFEKHGRTIQEDKELNVNYQLSYAAQQLAQSPWYRAVSNDLDYPDGWNKDIWLKMMNKPYKERLIIAGALIAAELDRINNITN